MQSRQVNGTEKVILINASGKEAAKNPQPAVENDNIINQDDFKKNLQDDLAPKKVNII